MLMTTDLIVASAGVAALAVVAWLLIQRRNRADSLEQERYRRCSDAWTELQQRCISLVEQDERDGASEEELQRAAAQYRMVIGDISVREAERELADHKQVPLLY